MGSVHGIVDQFDSPMAISKNTLPLQIILFTKCLGLGVQNCQFVSPTSPSLRNASEPPEPLGLTLGWNMEIIHLVLDETGNIVCI